MIPMYRLPTRPAIVAIHLLILLAGCDDEVAKVAREAADRQAQQNAAMAELQQTVARGTQELVIADAEARREMVGVHQELQAERERLDTGRDALEAERQHAAQQRRTESLLVPTLEAAGVVLTAIVIVGFLWHVLARERTNEAVDVELRELLVAELLAQPSPKDVRPRLPTSHATAALPSPEDLADSSTT